MDKQLTLTPPTNLRKAYRAIMFGPIITIWDFNKGFAVDILNLLNQLIVSHPITSKSLFLEQLHIQRGLEGYIVKPSSKSEYTVGNLLIPESRRFVSPTLLLSRKRNQGQ